MFVCNLDVLVRVETVMIAILLVINLYGLHTRAIAAVLILGTEVVMTAVIVG